MGELNLSDREPFYGEVNKIEVSRGKFTGGAFVESKEIVGRRYYRVCLSKGLQQNLIFFDEDMNVLDDHSEDSDLFDFEVEPLAREVVENFVEMFPPE